MTGPAEQLLIPHDEAVHLVPEYAEVLAELGYGHLLHACPEGAHELGAAVADEAERRMLGDLENWKPEGLTGMAAVLGIEPGGS